MKPLVSQQGPERMIAKHVPYNVLSTLGKTRRVGQDEPGLAEDSEFVSYLIQIKQNLSCLAADN